MTPLRLVTPPVWIAIGKESPTVTLGTNEIALSNLPALSTNNILLGRSTTGAGNFEQIDLTTTGLGYYTGAGGTRWRRRP